jgi:hypothetical protein
MEIAVLMGINGEIMSIQEAGELQVYQYSCQIWEMNRSIPFSLPARQGLQGLREYMKTVLNFLGDCQTLIGLSVIGLPLFELEKAGITIMEKAGSPANVLESVLERPSKAQLISSPDLNISMPRPEPREISPGCYSISLKEIQNCSGMVTSKQILFPLLEKMSFENLIIICSHVPPWLEVKILGGEVNGVIHRIAPNEVRIIISR